MRLFDPGLPITVTTDEDGRPTMFRWDGEPHRVDSIEDVREPKLDTVGDGRSPPGHVGGRKVARCTC